MKYPDPFFTPDPEAAAASRIMDFTHWAARHRGVAADADYAALHRWSVTDLEGFWGAVWEYFDIEADTPYEQGIRKAIRTGASPRHIPDEILEVPAIPHTRTGKKLEVPVKRLIQGAPAEQVVNRAAVDAPELVEYYARLGAERRGRRISGT